MIRNLSIHALGKDHSIQSGIVFHSFLEKLCSVRSEETCFLSCLFGGEELFYLLQQGIFSGRNFFNHNALTVFSPVPLIASVVKIQLSII